MLPSAPWLLVVKVVCPVPSPQLTSTDHEVAFAFASLNEPRANEWFAPSFEL